MWSFCGSSSSFSSSANVGLAPGVAIGFPPVSPHSATSLSICLGSASYSILSSHHLMTLFKDRASLASSGPGPTRGPMVTSYSFAMLSSSQSNDGLGPLNVKSSPWTEHTTLFSSL